MKLLHTADWHVGKLLRGRSRAEEHRAVLAEIAGIAQAEEVDAVLVCGDLFDTAAPTPEAEAIVYEALLALAATGATVVVLAGNHDSDRRLRAVAPLLELGKVVTRAGFRPAAEARVEVAARDGSTLVVAPIPFLSQRYVVDADRLLHGDAADARADYHARYAQVVADQAQSFGPDTVGVLAAHAFVHGALQAGSERTAHTVFGYGVPAATFPAAAHYVALGHLHRPQAVAGPCPIRYSGSLLQLDFGEVDDRKSVTIVEAVPGAPASVHEVALVAGRRLRQVRGTVAELEALAADLDPDAWVKAVVTEKRRVGLAEEVRAVLPGVVDVVIDAPSDAMAPPTPVEARSPRELFAAYLEAARVEDPRLLALFDELHDEAVGA